MKIYVDADACPVAVREILIRAANRTAVPVVFVSNHPLSLQACQYIQQIQVSQGFDIADNEIVQRVQSGELVVTSDIPLAAEVIEKQALALSPRGELFTSNNIRARLNMRDFMETMRSSGVQSGGPPPFGATEKKQFAQQLDKWLARLEKRSR